MAGPPQWSLFIDETGNFRTDCAAWAVAGVLLPHPAHDIGERLLEAVRTALPQIPYPPHATELRVAGAHAAYALMYEQQHGAKHPDARMREAANVIRANQRSEWGVRLRSAIEQGKPLGYHDLQLLYGACNPRVRGALDVCRSAAMEGVRSVLAAASTLGGVAIVAAVDPNSDDEPEDFYLELLEVALERAVALATPGEGASSELQVHVAARKVGPEDARVYLRAAHVEPMLRKAVAEAQRCPGAGAITCVAPRIVNARAPTISAGIVVADFVANNVRPLIGAEAWADVEAAAGRRLRLPVRCACAPLASVLPSAAASGAPRAAVHAAARGETAVPLAASGWHSEQAQQWIAALARSTR